LWKPATIRAVLTVGISGSSLVAYLINAAPVWVFVLGVLAVVAFADWIRLSTDQLAMHVGPMLGGLLTVSFGSIAELVLAIFVLARGQIEVVHAQITGSIIGTTLLGLGLALVVGGTTNFSQQFKRERASLLSSMLIVVVIALLLPAVFDYMGRSVPHSGHVQMSDEALSLVASAVLLVLYGGNLVYTLATHHDVFFPGESSDEGPRWSVLASTAVLAGAVIGAALESEAASGALEEAARVLNIRPSFVGVIVLGLVGTSADIFAAIWFAHRNQVGLVMSICIGSAIQVALVVAPMLVIISFLSGRSMTLVFRNPLDLFSISAAAFIVNSIAADGETTWFEGMLLVGVYVVLAAAYFID
jgi:Ca2+:H+ antiporter